MKLTNQSRLGAGLADEITAAYDMMVATPVMQETGGLLLTDGTEQEMYVREAPPSVFEPRVVMIGLDDMVALDELIVRVYYRLSSGGGWDLCDYQEYVGEDGGLTDGKTMIAVALWPCRHGVKVTVEQTVGTATLVWCAVEEA